jgi:phosphatidate cytidylyltransferase
MLKTRIITAVILLLVFLVALFGFPPSAWFVFATLIAAVAAWEWGALMGMGQASRVVLGVVFGFICIVIAAFEPAALDLAPGFSDTAWKLGRWFYLPAAAVWLVVVPLWMNRRWPLPKSIPGVIVGLVLLLPTWLAFIQLKHLGALTLLAIMATVWLADIAAYFSGRAFGRHKLAPTISPGKTWEGALGGGLAVIAYGFILQSKLPDAFLNHSILLLFALVFLSVLSIIGDLFESLLKRQAGLKDSSNVLPGHGGILDRIDSLTSTLPLVTLAWLITSS